MEVSLKQLVEVTFSSWTCHKLSQTVSEMFMSVDKLKQVNPNMPLFLFEHVYLFLPSP